MPLILGTNSIKDTGYDVANSCRFNGADSAELTLTPTAGNQKTWTFSFWTKRTTDQIGVADHVDSILEAGHATNPWFVFTFNNDVLNVSQTAGTSAGWDTAAKFRDTSAWYHIVLAVDTTSSTSSISNGSTDRMRIFVNGVQQTLASGSVPSQNADLQWSSNVGAHLFGQSYAGQYFDGYAAEVVFIDGLALAPTSFGEFNEDSPTIWQPIDVSGLTFGSEGYYLDFADSGNLGDDESGNGNDWTEVNLAATDQSTDTCTNNFATLNPLSQGVAATSRTFSEGNTAVSFGGADDSSLSSIGVSAGKWYCEFKVTNDAANPTVGVGNESSAFVTNPGACNIGSSAGAYGYFSNGQKRGNAASLADYGDTFTDDDIISIAFDADNGTIWFAKNGTWQASATEGEIEAGTTTNAAFSSISMAAVTFFIGCSNSASGTTGDAFAVNFGNPPYANSSSVADENGYGDFEYSVPDGFLALCTKNLGSDGG